MSVKKAFLLLAGQAPAQLPNLDLFDVVCAADGAFCVLEERNIKPDLIVGDFDSLKNRPKSIEMMCTPDQNFTDFDKALNLLKTRGFQDIDVYGANGKEPDHFLGNISTAMHWKNRLNICFFDDFGRYFFCEKSLSIEAVKGRIVSLIPLPVANNVTTQGLAYALHEETLQFGKRIGTRNKAVEDKIHISFKSGDLLVYVGNPKNKSL
jgi:thiamine pyrophosphokinase